MVISIIILTLPPVIQLIGEVQFKFLGYGEQLIWGGNYMIIIFDELVYEEDNWKGEKIL